MDIDVIVLSYTKDDSIFEMNLNCFSSIINSSKNHKFNIILVETESTKTFNYSIDNVKVIQPNEPFNYNRFLNIGLKHCKNDWILITNNDTIYYEDFLENMFIANSLDSELLSMSPIDDDYIRHKDFDRSIDRHYGYRVSYEISGWSILMNRKVLEKIGNFDEQFDFWYQDGDYAKNLENNGIKHALITSSKVKHLISKSHNLIEENKKYDMTRGAGGKFIKKWGSV